MLPITIVTGFLGSGKTTLINQFLNTGSEGIVVFVNEFGDVDIDGKIIGNGDIERPTVSLPNGCVCCEVRDDLVDAICDAAADSSSLFQMGIIETSGVASPSEILRNFQTDNRLKNLRPALNVVCVCFAEKVEQQLERYPEAANQIAMADHIVINRTSSFAGSNINEVNDLVLGINPNARVWIDIGPSKLPEIFRNSKGNQFLQTFQQTSVHHHHDYSTFVIESLGSIDPDLFRDTLSFWIMRYPERLLRVKGIIHFSDLEEPHLINLVHDVFTSEPWTQATADKRIKLVFIGINLPEHQIRRDINGIIGSESFNRP